MEKQKITFDRFIRGFITILLITSALLLVNRLRSVLLPFVIAWFIAYMIYPLVKLFQYKFHFKSRILSIICALLTIIGLGVGIFYLVAPSIIVEFGILKDMIMSYITTGGGKSIPNLISKYFSQYIDLEYINNILNSGNLISAIKEVAPHIWDVLAKSFNILFSILASLIAMLYVFFILMDYETFSDGWPHLIAPKYRTFSINMIHDIQESMNKYFRGQALVAFCVGILFSIGFLIIGFPMAIILGLFIGILNMIPYLQIVGLIPTLILAILKSANTGQNFWIIIAEALLIFAIVQAIQDIILTPKIMGKITGLNPAIILLSLSIWGSLLGILGMIIALPLTTLMLSYYHRYIINKEPIYKDDIKKHIKKYPDEKMPESEEENRTTEK
ncbi:MAG: AI-2E family transporter [Bacteroidaceae bacterium]|nr:AI-2E family transporter [Bacteroidaceae bacterium]